MLQAHLWLATKSVFQMRRGIFLSILDGIVKAAHSPKQTITPQTKSQTKTNETSQASTVMKPAHGNHQEGGLFRKVLKCMAEWPN